MSQLSRPSDLWDTQIGDLFGDDTQSRDDWTLIDDSQASPEQSIPGGHDAHVPKVTKTEVDSQATVQEAMAAGSQIESRGQAQLGEANQIPTTSSSGSKRSRPMPDPMAPMKYRGTMPLTCIFSAKQVYVPYLCKKLQI